MDVTVFTRCLSTRPDLGVAIHPSNSISIHKKTKKYYFALQELRRKELFPAFWKYPTSAHGYQVNELLQSEQMNPGQHSDHSPEEDRRFLLNPAEPVVRPKETARRVYNGMSSWYDLLSSPSEGKYRRAGLQALNPQPGECILEIGCGTGHSMVDIAAAVTPEGTACGLDLSERMADITRHRLAKRRLSGHSMILQADGAALPLPPESFDAVFMSFTLELFDTPELPLVLEACRRILKPGGRLVLVTMPAEASPSLMIRLYLRLRRVFPAVLDCRPIPAELLLQNAGFTITSQQVYSMFGFPIAIISAIK